MTIRTETDAFGTREIPAHAYWGPQTERARRLFAIGADRIPVGIIHAFGVQKAAAARANRTLGLLPHDLAEAVIAAAEEMRDGRFDDQFPIALWQTGSGTQTNMNANEIIANRANERLGRPMGRRTPIHPNDHVNLGQSSNDTFPTIMHASVIRALGQSLIPSVDFLAASLNARADDFHAYVKLGSTHLQDALPITLGAEFRAWAHQLAAARAAIDEQADRLCQVAQGGTASGSGINGQPDLARAVADALGVFAGRTLWASPAPSHLMAAHDGFVALSGALNVLAGVLMKICNDIRLLTSSLGGRPGMALPDDGLSSSIMPGKRNATVCEAVLQVCLRVIGNWATVLGANTMGTLQLNVCKLLILNETLDSIRLLSDAQRVLATGRIEGLGADRAALGEAVLRSPVLGTLLAPALGYDAAARLTREAVATGTPVRTIATQGAVMTGAGFDALMAQVLDPDTLDPGGTSPRDPVTAPEIIQAK